MAATADRIEVGRYLGKLRDPVDGQPLRIREDGRLEGTGSGAIYDFVGAFPDLRPGHGVTAQALPVVVESIPALPHRDVLDHYDDRPCNNYLALDNVPLGRYLRERRYDALFERVEFMVEVGSGKGAIARAFQEQRGLQPFCIDLAYGSLRHVREKPLCLDGALGSNLRLPLADNVADLVISYGVIHHTPDPLRCFLELARILKPGGRLLLNVYNWESVYRSLYFFLSPPLKGMRRTFGRRFGDLLLQLSAYPPYYAALWTVLAVVQKRWRPPPFAEGYEQFADFFLTPIARFYYPTELRTLADAGGLEVIEQETGGWPNNRFAHFVWYRKR
jgi:SAM-dependent methyltransferase